MRKILCLEIQEDQRPRKLRKYGPEVGERFLASLTWDVPLFGEDVVIGTELWRQLWEELGSPKSGWMT